MADKTNKNNAIPLPYEIIPVDPENNQNLLKDFSGLPQGHVQVGPKKYIFQNNYHQLANKYYNFQAKADDVWIVSFPRSGTTLTQEIVWLLEYNLDYDAAAKENLLVRSPHLDQNLLIHHKFAERISEINPWGLLSWYLHFDRVVGQESPRIIKAHLPFSLLPPSIFELNCKIIYVARNPMDVSVSMYHLARLYKFLGYIGDFKTFWEYYEKGLIMYGPHLEHIQEAWDKRNKSNVFFEFYENIIKDLPQYVKNIAEFLNKEISQSQIEKLLNHLNINNFRNNSSVNNQNEMLNGFYNKDEQPFIRKGQIMNNAEEFTPELRECAIKWIKEQMKNYDFRFPIEEFN